jgi:GH25 family lysozyme M1 (1,4-beta-N-acetylmuramidase)
MRVVHRRYLAAVVAFLIALAAVPLTPQGAAADSNYATTCTARLRATPATTGTSLVSMPTGTIVTVTGTVSGGSWSATCVTAVSGSTWYAISTVNGTSVSTLFGVSVAYAATGLFQPSTAPPPPPATYLEGLDVSHYQGTIDWSGVAGAGKRFAIMKATEGQAYVDPTYATNHAAARAVGLPVSAYHFANPSSAPDDAVLEADWYVNNAALIPGDMVPALDLEQTGGLSVSALQAWVGTWLGEVSTKLGVRPMIYTSPAFWSSAMGDTTMFADQGYSVLWIAHWATSSPTVPADNWGGHGWTFWQYSNCGSVTGISGCVDLDRYNGTDLSAVTFNYTYVAPPPVVPPNLPPVLAGIAPTTAPAGGGDLSISIQGTDFAPNVSVAYWNGTPLATTYVSPNQLTALVPAALTTTVSTSLVTVVNQPPGGGSSVPMPFTVTLPAAQVALAPDTNVVTWGQPVTLDVQVGSSGANRTLTLQRMQSNETQWSVIGSVTTDANGRATLTYTPPVNTQFQAVYAGGPDLGAGTSPPVRVVVRQLVLLRPTSLGRVTSIAAGTQVAFTATVRPVGPTLAPAKVTFQFWRQVSGRWQYVTKRDVYVDASGRARWPWVFTSRGQWYVRAVADPTQTNANSFWSPPERFSVF